MKTIKRLTIILTFLTLLSNISFSYDIHKHKGVTGFYLNDRNNLRSGLQKITKNKYKEFFEKLPEAKKWMEDAGFTNPKEFVKNLEDVLERCLQRAIQKIIASDKLSKEFKDEFAKNINREGIIHDTSIFFEKKLTNYMAQLVDATIEGEKIRIQLNATITRTGLKERHLKRIIDYVAAKLANTKPGENPKWGDCPEVLKDYISTLMHELMHYFGRLRDTDHPPDQDEEQRFECIIYCMEYMAFGIIYPGIVEDCKKNCGDIHEECRTIAGCKKKKTAP